MRKETDYILFTLKNTLNGTPWYGRSVYVILGESDPAKAAIHPSGQSHSLLELLYHMLSWSEFTRLQLEDDPGFDAEEFEKTMDWRVLREKENGWEKGLMLFRESNDRILELLSGKEDDSYLSELAKERKYNFRFLLQGFIQHNIYHQGQIALLNKLL